MCDEKTAKFENLRIEYKEVCQNLRAISDFRGKLLTLLPMVSGAGIYLIIPKKINSLDFDPVYLVAIGLFGFLITFGLFLHERRGIDHCEDLIELGKCLEKKLELGDGQLIREYNYYNPGEGGQRYFNRFQGPPGAAWIIYLSVAAAWLYLAVVGIKILFFV